jgi:hypothetical protein
MELEQALARIAELENSLSAYGDLDPAAIAELRSRASQYDQLHGQVESLTAQVSELETTASRSGAALTNYRALVAAGINPTYADVGMQLLQPGEGESIEAAALAMKERYPDIFVSSVVPQGTGTVSESAPPASTAAVVQPTNGMVVGLDPTTLLQGKAVIQ